MSTKAKNNSTLLVLLLVGISSFFRFFHLAEWLPFGMDQEYQLFLVKNIVNALHFPLIGVNASDTGIYLGPFFTYLTAFFYLFTRGNPLLYGAIASSWGVITTIAMFVVFGKWFGKKIGFISSLFYGSSFLVSFYDRQYWNPSPLPFLSLLMAYFLHTLEKGNKKSLIWFSLIFSISIQCHLSAFIFIPVFIFVFFKAKVFRYKKELLISLFIFILSILPIVLFDLRHNFQNTHSFSLLLTNQSTKQKESIFSRVQNTMYTVSRFFSVPLNADLALESGQCNELIDSAKKPGLVLIIFSTILFLYGAYNLFLNRKKNNSNVIYALFLCSIIYILFYGRQTFEYYLLYLFPFISLIFGFAVAYLRKIEHGEIISIPVVIIFLMLNTASLFTSYRSYPYTEKIKAAESISNRINGKTYNLLASRGCQRYGGYRYIFEYYAGRPQYSYMDEYFDWIYGKSSKRQSDFVVYLSLIDERFPDSLKVTNEEDKYNLLKERNLIASEPFTWIHSYLFK